MALRPYQSTALANVRAAIAAGHQRVLLVAPTGAGKTTIARAMIEGALASGRRVLFLAHRRELLTQCGARLAGLPFGYVAAGLSTTAAPVQIASIQTLARREAPTADLVIIDEAHRAAAASYLAALARYPAARVVGLTATPWRLDGHGLADLFSASVLAATPAQLIADGYLAPFTGFAFDSPALHDLPQRAGDFAPRGLELLMGAPKLAGNIVANWQRHAAGQPTIAFACSRAHAADLAARFTAAGVAAESVDGSLPAAERDRRIDAFRAGRTMVLTSVSLLTEGFDLPSISCVILARPTLSLAVYLQQVGRGLRPAPGKVARIHDHAGNVAIHGLPDSERDYSLTATVRGRLAPADELTALRTCSECFAIFPDAATCPACGVRQAPRPRALKEIEAEAVALAEAAARGRARESKSGQLLASLFAEARSRGYLDGWALFRFKQRQGRFPTKAERAAADELAGQRGAA